MPEYIKGKPEGIRCLLEKGLCANRNLFKLVHDGSQGGSRFYTKVYRMVLDGKPVNTWIRFTYDLRAGWADVSFSYKAPAEIEKQLERANGPKEKAEPEKIKETV